MPALDRNVKITCGNCGTSVTKKNLSRYKKNCSAGTLYCSKCANFFTKSTDDLNYLIAKSTVFQDLQKHTSVNYVMQNFPVFMLHVNTKTLNGEDKLDSEWAILMWRI